MRFELCVAGAALASALASSATRVSATTVHTSARACDARCSCFGEPLPETARRWRQKDTTLAEPQSFWIRGTVTAVRQVEDTTRPPPGAPLGWRTDRERTATDFRVTSGWGRPVGRGAPREVVLTIRRYSLCPEPSWKVGRAYLVYVAVRADMLVSGGPCWETHEASDSVAKRSLTELGAPDWRRR